MFLLLRTYICHCNHIVQADPIILHYRMHRAHIQLSNTLFIILRELHIYYDYYSIQVIVVYVWQNIACTSLTVQLYYHI